MTMIDIRVPRRKQGNGKTGWWLLAALLLLAVLFSTPAAATGLTDTLDTASAASERAHRWRFEGNVRREVVGDRVGGFETRRTVRTVRGPNSWVSFRLRVAPHQPATLEFEERYGRDRDVRGYLILVDGRKTYLRTWQGCGAGPIHFFVQIPPSPQRFRTVTLVNQAPSGFHLGRVWAFSDWKRYFAQSRMAVPFHLAPPLWLGADEKADRARLQTIKAALENHPNVRPAWSVWIPYASLNARETAEQIDRALRLAEQLNLPVQLIFDTWWANTPTGSDGRGGFWSDVGYQQVVFNATRHQYQLSIPNRWGNTPWLTVNDPLLNAFKIRRLRDTTAHLRVRFRDLLARNKQHLVLAINLDNEPVYWASGNAGLGGELLWADFNPHAIAAAHRSGVRLDPRDGLSFAERRWLLSNLTTYTRLIGGAAQAGLGRDAVVVGSGGTTFPGDLLRNNVFTQAWVANGAHQFPMQSAVFPLWEAGAPGNVRVGGEWNGNSVREHEAILHQIALGRNAAVNAESGNRVEENTGVLPGYALAQRYYTPYNYPLDKMDRAAENLRDLSKPFPAHRYLPVLRESHFVDTSWRRAVASSASLERALIGNTAALAVFPATTTRPGVLNYVLRAPGNGTFADGLFIELEGRAFVSGRKDKRVNIRVLAGGGADPSDWSEVGRVFDSGDINLVHRIDLT